MKVKKRFVSIFMALVCFCSLFSINAGAASSSNVYSTYTLYGPNKELYAGDSIQLIFYYPPDAEVKWSVSDSSVATVAVSKYKSSYFRQDLVKVTFAKAGTVKIKAVNKSTGEVVAKKEYTVNPYVKKIKFKDGSSYSIKKGNTATLKYALKNTKGEKISVSNIPSSLSFKAATSNKNVVKVKSTANGKIKIKAVGKGTAKIKVKAKDGSGVTSTIKIKVS